MAKKITIGQRLAELKQEATRLKGPLELAEAPDENRDKAVSMLEALVALPDPPANIAAIVVDQCSIRFDDDDELTTAKDIADELRKYSEAIGEWKEYNELMGWVIDLV